MQHRASDTSPWRRVNNTKMGSNVLRKLHVPLPREGSRAPPELSHLRNEARLQPLKGAAPS